MKAGLTTSLVLHGLAVGFALVSLSSPRPFEVTDVESFPVDIVPIEEIAMSVQGEREAPAAETPAPTPTTRPEPVEEAVNVGDNTVDLDTPPTPDPVPRPVETASAPAAEPEPEPLPVEETPPEPQAEPEPAPAPATEVAPEPQPQQAVEPDPAPDAAPAETPQAEVAALPEVAPRPQSRPQQPQAQTAQTPDRRETETPPAPRETARQRSEDSQFDEDQIAALLDQRAPSGGGAARSDDQAALGGRQTTGARLSQSEIDALKGQIQRCWNVPAGAADAQDLKVSVRMRLDPSGAIDGAPDIIAGGGGAGVERIAAEAARRAVLRCAPYNLPADKYDAWADVIVHFDPRDMF